MRSHPSQHHVGTSGKDICKILMSAPQQFQIERATEIVPQNSDRQ